MREFNHNEKVLQETEPYCQKPGIREQGLTSGDVVDISPAITFPSKSCNVTFRLARRDIKNGYLVCGRGRLRRSFVALHNINVKLPKQAVYSLNTGSGHHFVLLLLIILFRRCLQLQRRRKCDDEARRRATLASGSLRTPSTVIA